MYQAIEGKEEMLQLMRMISQSQTDSSQKTGQQTLLCFRNYENSTDHRDLPHPFPAEEELSTDLFLLGIASLLGGL